MEIHSDLMPAANATRLKNILRVLPYLAVMGMIWGYLAAALSGSIIGLLLASVTSVVISKAGNLYGQEAGKPENYKAGRPQSCKASEPFCLQAIKLSDRQASQPPGKKFNQMILRI